MTHEAAGVPTTRNDDEPQADVRAERDAPGAPGTSEAPGAPGEGAGDAAAGPKAGPGRAAESGEVRGEDGPVRGEDGQVRGEDGQVRGEDGHVRGEDGPVRNEDGQARPEARLARAVRVAEQALIEFEIAVETFRVEVENFSRLHHQRLGPMYARLDELDAQIAEARAARTGDPEDLRKAEEARSVVMPMPGVDELFHDWMDSDGLSPEASAMLTEQPVRPPKRVRPTEEARKLYRDLVRKAHPDLAQDEAERARRDEFIARVNAAYGRGDEALLKELAQEWAAGPVAPQTELSEADELYARLNWLTQRKELLTEMALELEESAIGAMLRMAPDDPDHLLEEVAEQLLGEVSKREAELAALVQ